MGVRGGTAIVGRHSTCTTAITAIVVSVDGRTTNAVRRSDRDSAGRRRGYRVRPRSRIVLAPVRPRDNGRHRRARLTEIDSRRRTDLFIRPRSFFRSEPPDNPPSPPLTTGDDAVAVVVTPTGCSAPLDFLFDHLLLVIHIVLPVPLLRLLINRRPIRPDASVR